MHSDYYQKNKAYAEGLRDNDPRKFQALPQMCAAQSFHEKYVQNLRAVTAEKPVILDVGCGVGQVVRFLTRAGAEAHGVEVSEASLEIAREHEGQFHGYDGLSLPFADATFDAVGAFNVLEHVEEPLALLDEMTRVLRPGGRLVISSPNFLRVLGYHDYHPRMRGVGQKWRNGMAIWRRLRTYAADPKAVIFEKMDPIHREPFQPDDDAIVVTNGIDFCQFLKSRGYEEIQASCVDRPVPKWMEAILDLTPFRFLILNSFVIARKRK